MSDFNESLAAWVRDFCDGERRKRDRQESIRRLESECAWMGEYIQTLRIKEKRKPSAIKEIRQWQYAKRRSEIELAFLYHDEAAL